jgi:hypothetical protein
MTAGGGERKRGHGAPAGGSVTAGAAGSVPPKEGIERASERLEVVNQAAQLIKTINKSRRSFRDRSDLIRVHVH